MNQYSIPQFIGAFAVVSLGMLVFWKGREKPLNRAFATFDLFTAGWLFTAGIVYLLKKSDYGLAFLLMKVSYTNVILIILPLLHLTVLLVGGHALRKWRIISGTLSCFFIWAVWNTKWFIQDLYYHHFGYYPHVGWIHPFFLSWLAMTMIAIHWVLLHQTKKVGLTSSLGKQAWYLWIAYLVFTPVVIDFVPNYGIDIYPCGFLFVLAFSITAAYVILKHQLLDIRIILRRSLVYSLLITGITAVYLVLIVIMERSFQGYFGYRSVLASALVAFCIALGFTPLRDKLQVWVERKLFSATPAELAEQREQLLAEVRRGEQMKAVGTLAAGLAHEIKNPLASIKTFTEYLQDKHNDPVFIEKFRKIVGGEVERVNLIVQQLLEFAKPVPPKLAPVQITKLLDDTLDLLNSELLKRQVHVTRDYAAVPPILGDSQQLKQVFLNLLLNSLQAVNGHGQITLRTNLKGQELEVTIEDNGCGIATKDLTRIFDPFFSTKPAGTGLGLAVVRGIVKEHGGQIEVSSQVTLGTKITVTLPIKP